MRLQLNPQTGRAGTVVYRDGALRIDHDNSNQFTAPLTELDPKWIARLGDEPCRRFDSVLDSRGSNHRRWNHRDMDDWNRSHRDETITYRHIAIRR